MMLAVALAIAQFALSIVHGEYGFDALLSLRTEVGTSTAELEALRVERQRIIQMIDTAAGADTLADSPDTQLRRTYSLIASGESILVR